MDIADEFSLHQLVSIPTRKENLLDFFFISNSTIIDQVMVVPGISDHDGIPMVVLSTKPKLNKQKPRKAFLYKKAKVNYLKSDLREMSELITSSV